MCLCYFMTECSNWAGLILCSFQHSAKNVKNGWELSPSWSELLAVQSSSESCCWTSLQNATPRSFCVGLSSTCTSRGPSGQVKENPLQISQDRMEKKPVGLSQHSSRGLFRVGTKTFLAGVSSQVCSQPVNTGGSESVHHSVVSGSATLWTAASSPPDSFVHGILQAKYWSRQPFASPGGIPDPGIELSSPALQADSLLSEAPGKPKYR